MTTQKLKFENVPTVVLLLFLACTYIASLTDYGKVAKITGRIKKKVFISAEGCVSQ